MRDRSLLARRVTRRDVTKMVAIGARADIAGFRTMMSRSRMTLTKAARVSLEFVLVTSVLESLQGKNAIIVHQSPRPLNDIKLQC